MDENHPQLPPATIALRQVYLGLLTQYDNQQAAAALLNGAPAPPAVEPPPDPNAPAVVLINYASRQMTIEMQKVLDNVVNTSNEKLVEASRNHDWDMENVYAALIEKSMMNGENYRAKRDVDKSLKRPRVNFGSVSDEPVEMAKVNMTKGTKPKYDKKKFKGKHKAAAMWCDICKRDTHTTDVCYKSKTCEKCGAKGHVKRYCPTNNVSKQENQSSSYPMKKSEAPTSLVSNFKDRYPPK
jgi:hypothetical protein